MKTPTAIKFQNARLVKKYFSALPSEILIKVIHEGKKTGIPEMHKNAADLFYMVSGSVKFITGGDLINSKKVESDLMSTIGESIYNGKVEILEPGDWFFIPPNCSHQRITLASSYLFLIKIPQELR